jgi:hypothetical protein
VKRYDEGRLGLRGINPAIWGLGLCIPAAATGIPALMALPALALAYRITEGLGRKSWLDQGGIRFVRWGISHSYLPFSDIERVEIDDSQVVAYDSSGAPIERWSLPELAPRSELYVALCQRVAAREETASSGFERRGQSLEDWCATLDSRSRAQASGAYRADSSRT